MYSTDKLIKKRNAKQSHEFTQLKLIVNLFNKKNHINLLENYNNNDLMFIEGPCLKS
jgi:hypothetical protein